MLSASIDLELEQLYLTTVLFLLFALISKILFLSKMFSVYLGMLFLSVSISLSISVVDSLLEPFGLCTTPYSQDALAFLLEAKTHVHAAREWKRTACAEVGGSSSSHLLAGAKKLCFC